MEIAYIIIGLALGFTLGFVLANSRKKTQTAEIQHDFIQKISDLEKNLAAHSAIKESLEKQYEEASRNYSEALKANSEYVARIASLETEKQNLNEKLEYQKKEIEEIRNRLNLEFENLANKILEEKSKRFTEQNRNNLDEILKPLNEKIKEFQKQVDETYNKEARERFSLQNEVKNLIELNKKISDDANNLTKALKGDQKVMGDWGEFILESILEKSGLQKGIEYITQQSFENEEEKRLRPDVIVKYPGNKSVIIDSKVSLVAYEKYANTEEPESKKQYLQEHLTSIRNHIKILSAKNYQNIYGLQSLDYVFMFIPIEPAFLAAIQNDRELWTEAWNKKILLISPTNLIAVLKIIAEMWRVDFQNRNAQEIARQSGELLNKFSNFLQDLDKIGQKIDDSKKHYEEARNKLYSGKGNLINRAKQLQLLGAKTSKNLPETLFDESDDEQNEQETS